MGVTLFLRKNKVGVNTNLDENAITNIVGIYDSIDERVGGTMTLTHYGFRIENQRFSMCLSQFLI